ncbi:MAG: serine protease [Methylococcales bacterium]
MKKLIKSNRLVSASLIGGACVFMAVSVFATPLSVQESSIQPKVYNGTSTNTQENPYMVALLNSSKADAFQAQFCGGTLIAKNWVLTAAHCVLDKAGQVIAANTVDVLVNRSALSSTDGERIAVENIMVHESYNQAIFDNDVALLKLKSPSDARPIELVSEFSDQDSAGNNAKVLGWGATYDYNSTFFGDSVVYADLLQQAELPIVSNATCQQRWGSKAAIINNQLCAGFRYGSKDACVGDSGGPLVVFDIASSTWRQAGIVSSGARCNGYGAYGIYARVKNYKSYISDRICAAEEKPIAPTLHVLITGALVNLSWNASDSDTKYEIIYSLHGTEAWHSLDMKLETTFSITLPAGSDFDVKINAYEGNCESYGWSNMERVAIS